MATITAQNLVGRAQIIIQDITGTRWPETELIGWLNDGQREVVLLKPDACVKNVDFELVAGTKQTLPTDGIMLTKVVRNRGPKLAKVDGQAIRLIDVAILDDQLPGWHSAIPVPAPDHYCYDERDPRNFYVYPPADAANAIEVAYFSSPTDVALVDTLAIDDIYANALLDYILYRAFSKDADYAKNDGRAAAAYTQFYRSLGKRVETEILSDPNTEKARSR